MRTFYVRCFAVLTCIEIIAGAANIHYPKTKHNNDWWVNTIIYQVYPRSFKDSNKDGIGDLRGIIQKLDHFVDLGIKTLWIGPFFKSPMDDMGYDVEDYRMIDPTFGTMQDFEELIFEMEKRNLKFITDMIPNHSSYKCDWFEKSKKRIGKYENYYIWRNASNQAKLTDPSIKPLPPNNWLSRFRGSAWAWNDERKQFYYHQFSEKQPDFNLRNPDVQNEILDIMKFWMTKGIIGFRLDAIDCLFESDKFQDEPYLSGKENTQNYNDMDHIYTKNQPEVFDIIYQWREFTDNFSKENNLTIPRIIVTESYANINWLMKLYGNKTTLGAHIPFNFGLLKKVQKNNLAESVDDTIKTWLYNMPHYGVPNWVIENHDNVRMPTKFGSEMVPIFTALKLALPGVDVTYYGGEIGMEDTYVRPDQKQDMVIKGVVINSFSRDYGRTPMQWDNSTNAGFTEEKKSWLPVNPNYYKLNVEAQKKIPTSNYNFYKKMAQLRETCTLKRGDLDTFNITKSIYILKRSLDKHESYLVVINFGSETETVELSNVISNLNKTLNVYLGSENSAYVEGNTVSTTSVGNPLQLRPQSVVVLTDKFIETKIQPHRPAEYPSTEHPPPSPHDHHHDHHHTSDSTQIDSKIINLLGALLLIKLVL